LKVDGGENPRVRQAGGAFHDETRTAMNETHEVVEHATVQSAVEGDITSVSQGRPFVYAIGRVEARFPTLSAEKEFAQATGRTDTAGKTDQQTFHTVLSKREHRYLARQLCWVLTIQGLETYLLQPRDPGDIDLLVEAIRPAPSPNDIDVVIGTRAGIASPDMCNGLLVPIVVFDQIYSFDRARPTNIAR
jgi:PatG Domain